MGVAQYIYPIHIPNTYTQYIYPVVQHIYFIRTRPYVLGICIGYMYWVYVLGICIGYMYWVTYIYIGQQYVTCCPTYIPNTYMGVAQYIYPHICIGYMYWVYILGYINMCWTTYVPNTYIIVYPIHMCSPIYMSTYPIHIHMLSNYIYNVVQYVYVIQYIYNVVQYIYWVTYDMYWVACTPIHIMLSNTYTTL